MATFFMPDSKIRKKYRVVYQYFKIISAFLCLVGLFYFDWNPDLKTVLRTILVLYFLWTAIDLLRRSKREHFIEITQEHISSKSADDISRVNWDDIRWIKKEKDGGITVFQESSFSKHFSLKDFSEEDRKDILGLLQGNANARQIRLINFSGTIPAVA